MGIMEEAMKRREFVVEVPAAGIAAVAGVAGMAALAISNKDRKLADFVRVGGPNDGETVRAATEPQEPPDANGEHWFIHNVVDNDWDSGKPFSATQHYYVADYENRKLLYRKSRTVNLDPE
jgi:hypothetical protein